MREGKLHRDTRTADFEECQNYPSGKFVLLELFVSHDHEMVTTR
jgi:hypothetical protein